MGYNRPKNNMKKIFYLLIACTMMCFAGCEEKGNEIDNTTDNTGENVEINEANLVGTWKIVSSVDTTIDEDGTVSIWERYFYDDQETERSYDDGEWDYDTTQRLFWNFAFTLNANHTYECEDEYIEAHEKEGTIHYDKRHEKENGTWSLKGKNFSFQWIEGCEEYLEATNKADLDKPYEETYCNTYEDEEYVAVRDGVGYTGNDYLDDLYEYAEIEEFWLEHSNSIIKLTSTELVVQTKSYHEKDERDDDEANTSTVVTIFKKVK
jgi:hypothetical protein